MLLLISCSIEVIRPGKQCPRCLYKTSEYLDFLTQIHYFSFLKETTRRPGNAIDEQREVVDWQASFYYRNLKTLQCVIFFWFISYVGQSYVLQYLEWCSRNMQLNKIPAIDGERNKFDIFTRTILSYQGWGFRSTILLVWEWQPF